jgi:hypothetical protein
MVVYAFTMKVHILYIWIKKERNLVDGRGGRGWGRSQTIPRRESLVLY